MQIRLLDTETTRLVRAALGGLAMRQRLYAANLANVETPGYQAQDVSFEAELRRWYATGTSPDAEPDLRMITVTQTSRADGNTVGVDEQMTLLAENALTYEALAQAQRLRGQLLRDAILEGRR